MNARRFITAAAAVLVLTGFSAAACTADIGKATTDCYVRSVEDGDVVGSLKKGDIVVVTGKTKKGYMTVLIGGETYKVYGEYLKIRSGVCLDEVKICEKVRRSRSRESGVYGKTVHSIEGSIFEGIDPW